LLKAAIPSLDACCLLCGPPPLVSDTTALLRRMGVSSDRILTEKY
jgi:ferredoxin-NADP reductase